MTTNSTLLWSYGFGLIALTLRHLQRKLFWKINSKYYVCRLNDNTISTLMPLSRNSAKTDTRCYGANIFYLPTNCNALHWHWCALLFLWPHYTADGISCLSCSGTQHSNNYLHNSSFIPLNTCQRRHTIYSI